MASYKVCKGLAFTISKVDIEENEYKISTIFCSPGRTVADAGLLLKTNYTDPSEVDALLELGDLTTVGILPTSSTGLIDRFRRKTWDGSYLPLGLKDFQEDGEEAIGFNTEYTNWRSMCVSWADVLQNHQNATSVNWRQETSAEMWIGMSPRLVDSLVYPVPIGSKSLFNNFVAWMHKLRDYSKAFANWTAVNLVNGNDFGIPARMAHYVYITEEKKWYFFMADDKTATTLREFK